MLLFSFLLVNFYAVWQAFCSWWKSCPQKPYYVKLMMWKSSLTSTFCLKNLEKQHVLWWLYFARQDVLPNNLSGNRDGFTQLGEVAKLFCTLVYDVLKTRKQKKKEHSVLKDFTGYIFYLLIAFSLTTSLLISFFYCFQIRILVDSKMKPICMVMLLGYFWFFLNYDFLYLQHFNWHNLFVFALFNLHFSFVLFSSIVTGLSERLSIVS